MTISSLSNVFPGESTSIPPLVDKKAALAEKILTKLVGQKDRLTQKITTRSETKEKYRALQQLGYDLDQSDSNGLTPLEKAFKNQDLELVTFLIKECHVATWAVPVTREEMLKAVQDRDIKKLKLIKLISLFGEDECLIINLIQNNKHEDVCFLIENCGYSIHEADLFHAISSETQDTLKLLITRFKLDVNQTHKYGLGTPLETAIKRNDPASVRQLLQLGADLKNLNLDLMKITMFENFEIFKILITEGHVNINQLDQYGMTYLGHALCKKNEKLVKDLKDLGADVDLVDEIIRRKLVSHVFDLPRFTMIKDLMVRLEGHSTAFVIPYLASQIQEFFKDLSHRNYLSSYEDMTSTFSNFYTEASQICDILERLKAQKSALIAGGTPRHSVDILICNGMLFVCNRGEGKTMYEIEIFQLNPEEINEKLIAQLKQLYGKMDTFNKMIANLKLPRLGGIPLESQKVGNCSWVSIKTCVLAYFFANIAKLDFKELVKNPIKSCPLLVKSLYYIFEAFSYEHAFSTHQDVIKRMADGDEGFLKILTDQIEKSKKKASLFIKYFQKKKDVLSHQEALTSEIHLD